MRPSFEGRGMGRYQLEVMKTGNIQNKGYDIVHVKMFGESVAYATIYESGETTLEFDNDYSYPLSLLSEIIEIVNNHKDSATTKGQAEIVNDT